MDHAEVCILQEASQVILCSFLQSHDHMHLEAQVNLSYVLGYFTDQSHEGVLVYEDLYGPLVSPDLTEPLSPAGTSRASSQGLYTKILPGGLSPNCRPNLFPHWLPLAGTDGPALATIWASCWVGDNPGHLPASFSLFASCFLSPTTLVREECSGYVPLPATPSTSSPSACLLA